LGVFWGFVLEWFSSSNQRTPPFSVAAIIPTYNYAHGIKQAIASVLNQTLRPVEIIVVDDGSTDGTRGVLDTYGSRINSFCQQNRGRALREIQVFLLLTASGLPFWITTTSGIPPSSHAKRHRSWKVGRSFATRVMNVLPTDDSKND
jgi:cellulose synthase/poly-beta-1,6-N-acetylglucosamine synthase-like glycosyltransferase